jgi:hypothetical protein
MPARGGERAAPAAGPLDSDAMIARAARFGHSLEKLAPLAAGAAPVGARAVSPVWRLSG